MNEQFLLEANKGSNVKNIIAVMSGKGGVGKSSVSALLAASLAREGFKVGILDADITGPSIPKMFGLKEKPGQAETGLIPVQTSQGIKVMSLNLLLDSEETPVVWRGPIISGTVKQFWTDVIWGDLDYLVVDLPPGTGDVPLTVLQSLPLTGVVMVSSPQDLASMIVKKAINMVKSVGTPILGLIENMSFVECPDCGRKIYLFGRSKVKQIAENTQIPVLGVLPIDPVLAELADAGKVAEYNTEVFKAIPGLVNKGAAK